MAKMATPTPVGKKSIFLKKPLVEYFAIEMVSFLHPWGVRNKRDPLGFLKKILKNPGGLKTARCC